MLKVILWLALFSSFSVQALPCEDEVAGAKTETASGISNLEKKVVKEKAEQHVRDTHDIPVLKVEVEIEAVNVSGRDTLVQTVVRFTDRGIAGGWNTRYVNVTIKEDGTLIATDEIFDALQAGTAVKATDDGLSTYQRTQIEEFSVNYVTANPEGTAIAGGNANITHVERFGEFIAATVDVHYYYNQFVAHGGQRSVVVELTGDNDPIVREGVSVSTDASELGASIRDALAREVSGYLNNGNPGATTPDEVEIKRHYLTSDGKLMFEVVVPVKDAAGVIRSSVQGFIEKDQVYFRLVSLAD